MNMKMNTIYRQALKRESGIELLKIIGIALIVISHVCTTLRTQSTFMPSQDYVINLSCATENTGHFLLTIMSYFGIWGNDIFFICSAWFLLKSNYVKKEKWLLMLVEVWVISVVILLIVIFTTDIPITKNLIIKSFFPTTFSNNWYTTCYLLFYPIHPILNKIISVLNKKNLLRISLAMTVLYCGFSFVNSGWFFASTLILWITIYLVMAYLQIYLGEFSDSIKGNVILLLISALSFILFMVTMNYLGLHVSFMNNRMLHWINKCNPFFIAMSISLLNLFRKFSFKKKSINYISSLSLLIYIIHENIILRTYFRPMMWAYVYSKYGYSQVVLWVLIISTIVFIFGFISAILYDITFRKYVVRLNGKMYLVIRRVYLKIEQQLLKL